jgi:TatD DNase family protein
MNMGWIDSHCHLDFDDFEQTSLFAQLLAQGCEGVLIPATQARFFDRVLALKQAYPDLVRVALGLHPYFVSQHQIEDLQLLDQAISRVRPDAIGEFGLDFMLDDDTLNKQFHYFNQQLELAKAHKLPLVIHCRKAHDRLASEFTKSKFQQGGFIHGFSGSMQQATRFLSSGFVLGLGGALTYERAKAMHKMVAALPDDAYTLETDSPDMRPSFARNEINTPLNVPIIAQHIADLRGQSVEQVLEHSSRNFRRVLGE